MGTQQSGVLDFKLADLARDGQIVQLSKNDVDQILKEDVNLSAPENQIVKKELIRIMKLKPNWSNIS
jgi:ATP-dependent DNA helicase RecG